MEYVVSHENGARYNSMVEQWVIGSIPHGEPIE